MFKKGSKEAKAYMAKIRGKRKTTKKAAPKKAAKKTIGKKPLPVKSQILRTDLKAQKLKLPGGYNLVKRIAGLFDLSIIKDLDSLKKQYHKLAKIYHPDKGGTDAQFRELNNEYDKLFKKLLSGSNLTEDQKKNEIVIDENLREALNAVISLPGINIELVGQWIWISGLTFAVRSELKGAGFMWAPKKQMWYYAGVESAGRGKSDINEIRAKYGTTSIKKTDFKNLNGIKPIVVPAKNRAKFKAALKKVVNSFKKRYK